MCISHANTCMPRHSQVGLAAGLEVDSGEDWVEESWVAAGPRCISVTSLIVT